MYNTCGERSAHSEWLQYVGIKRVQENTRQGMFKHPLGLMQEIKVCEMWYKHKVCTNDIEKNISLKNDIVKILWDVCIQLDRQIKHRRPDIAVIEKNTNKCLTIDIAYSIDNNLI